MARAESPCVLPTAELDDARTHLISPPSSMLSSLVAPAQAPAPISLRCVMPERASGPMKDPSSGSAARHRLIDRQAHVHQTPCQLQLLLEGYIADAEPLSSSVEAGSRTLTSASPIHRHPRSNVRIGPRRWGALVAPGCKPLWTLSSGSYSRRTQQQHPPECPASPRDSPEQAAVHTAA